MIPNAIQTGAERVLRLTNTYSIRSTGNQDWKSYQVDQGMYLSLKAARIGVLKVFISQSGRNLVGPIHPLINKPVELASQFRSIQGTPDDWFLTTYPMSYAVLLYRVGGRNIGVAVHAPNTRCRNVDLYYAVARGLNGYCLGNIPVAPVRTPDGKRCRTVRG